MRAARTILDPSRGSKDSGQGASFIRRGITIPDIRTNGDKAARALIVIDDQALSTFLGDAENPAHSDWSERADKIRTQYDHGVSTLRFVKKSASFESMSITAAPLPFTASRSLRLT